MNTGLLILFALLQAADIWTTLTVLKQGGRELNPLLAALFSRFDPLTVMVIVKLAGVWVLWWIDVWQITLAGCVVFAYVVNRNYWEIKR
jgi:putative effector of murein hydrolase LrgA (UPF0299 family)